MPDSFPTLRDIATACGADPATVDQEALQGVRSAMWRYSINTELRQSHFCAQIGHESNSLQYREEIWGPTQAQRRYEPPSDLAQELGNTERGDGERYKGRGYIQLTGKANYERYADVVDADVVQNPDLVATPRFAADVAGWYWERHKLNEMADEGVDRREEHSEDVLRDITKAINGGYNGLSDRRKRLMEAKERIMDPRVDRVSAEEVEPVGTGLTVDSNEIGDLQ